MTQKMNKPEQKPEDLDIEILVNSVMAAQNACNAASAALRGFLRKRAGVSSAGTPERPVRPTFMARASRMVHEPESAEGDQNGGQEGAGSGDGGGNGLRGQASDGGQDETRGDNPHSEDATGSAIQQG